MLLRVFGKLEEFGLPGLPAKRNSASPPCHTFGTIAECMPTAGQRSGDNLTTIEQSQHKCLKVKVVFRRLFCQETSWGTYVWGHEQVNKQYVAAHGYHLWHSNLQRSNSEKHSSWKTVALSAETISEGR